MGYPEKLLADDEQVIEHLHPHWITLFPAILWFLVLCVASAFGIAELPTGGTSHKVGLIAIIVVAVALLCWLTLAPVVRWRSTHYIFTTHRVLIRRGVLHHVGRDIALQRISDVAFSQSLWDRIVRAGSITIESAGEHGQETLVNVPRSADQQQLLNRLIEQDSDRRNGRGYPPPGNPQQGYPPQGYPQQGQPPGYPSQSYPQPGYPPQQ